MSFNEHIVEIEEDPDRDEEIYPSAPIDEDEELSPSAPIEEDNDDVDTVANFSKEFDEFLDGEQGSVDKDSSAIGENNNWGNCTLSSDFQHNGNNNNNQQWSNKKNKNKNNKNNYNNNNRNNNNNNKNNYNNKNNNNNYNNNNKNNNNNNSNNNNSNNFNKDLFNNNWSLYARLFKLDSVKSALMFLFRFHAARHRHPHLLESWVLFLHYRLACLFFFSVAIAIWFHWYLEEEIVCVNAFDGTKFMKPFLLNICLSYSFHRLPDGTKRPLLFYRWVPFAFLMVAHALYLPRFLMKRLVDPRAQRLLVTLADGRSSISTQNIVRNYFMRNLGIHRFTYVAFVSLHILAGLISTIALYFLDFVLQGQFLSLLWETFPFTRDVIVFRDPLSLVFPPFVTCLIDSPMNMQSARAETFHCHLTLMELLEKVFIISWVIVAGLCVVSAAAAFVLLVLPFVSRCKRLLFKTNFTTHCPEETKRLLVTHLDFGDAFVLWVVREYLTDDEFCDILIAMGQVVLRRRALKSRLS